MSDELIELPEGWQWTRFEEITTNFDGQRIPVSSKERESRQGQFPYYGASGIIDYVDNYLFDGKYLLIAEDGANLLSRSTPIAFEAEDKFWVNNHAHVVQTIETTVLSSYLRDYINFSDLRFYISGSAQPKLNQKNLNSIPVPLPPIAEQKRIVAKIEELRSKTQKAREALEAIPEMCDRFRQSVLAAAFRGELTADWREQNPDIEPAEVLLEKIQEERASKKLLKSINKSDLPDLPEGWCWSSVELFADVGTGATPLRSEAKYYDGGNIPWITSGALNNLFIKEAEEYITPSAIQETNAKIFPKHTLLIAMYGEGKTRGKVSELLIEAATNQACAALIFEGIASKIQPIVKLFFQKNYSDIRKLASGGVQPNLNLSMIKTTVIPVPPLEEQLAILQSVSSCMSSVDRIQQQYEAAKARLEKLDRAILAQAFRGELVPQDPNDEPASVLLERIREERAKASDRKSTKRKR